MLGPGYAKCRKKFRCIFMQLGSWAYGSGKIVSRVPRYRSKLSASVTNLYANKTLSIALGTNDIQTRRKETVKRDSAIGACLGCFCIDYLLQMCPESVVSRSSSDAFKRPPSDVCSIRGTPAVGRQHVQLPALDPRATQR